MSAGIIDLEAWNEAEYGVPLADTIAGYFDAGETLQSTAEILRISPRVVARTARKNGIELPYKRRRPAMPHTQETRARIAAGIREAQRARLDGYNVHRLEFQGENLTLAEWSDRIGLERHALNMRIRRGWSVERALTTPNTRGDYGPRNQF